MNVLTKILLSFLLLFSLSACVTAFNGEEDNVKQDYLLLKAEADKAYEARDYKIAEEKYLTISKAVGRDPDAWFKLGNIYARTQQPQRAIIAYHEAVIRDSKLSKAWNNLAIVYLRQSLNAYTSLLSHAGKDDPLAEMAEMNLEKLYAIVGKESAAPALDESTAPAGQ